jgi:uncharacterized membrane protein YphA (DoxX/SURF4 family)
MTVNEATSSLDTSSAPSGRAAIVSVWVIQILLAAMFLMAGGSKLAGAPAMVELFKALGFGKWFRYVTGAVEVTSAVLLLIPSMAAFGALLLVPTMIGAIAANISLGQSPAVPGVLLILAAAVAWVRRTQIRDAFSR